MESLASPPPFKKKSNHVESWKLWKHRFQFYVDAASLNAKLESQKLGLIRKSDNINGVNCCKSIPNLLCKYNQVFEGLGNLSGKYRITLCENSLPVVSVTRKVALSLLEPLKAELDRMVKAGVIENLTETIDWVSPLVIVQNKNAALQACLDPQKKNRAIKRPQYNLPTYEDIASKLAGAKYFSVLDAVSAFLANLA
ncbi:hypothetical protein AVEN_262868-1 [Araneus ventricosus]|uniref:Uncharacterized protein n=1 Tax=Araneus ventricosus TaxID=182803 RepID=A0A4Y2DFX1_ARAVE|nr:hypothetical protein AVEN_262868-1 [Araneus ventricosus]